MESRNSYCFEYLVTKAKMPRKRTCCPFMQRTMYRVTRNLARLDLGFTCPDVEGSDASHISSTATPTLSKRKKKASGTDHGNSESRTSAVGVLSWLVKGTIGRKPPSANHLDTLTSIPPLESNYTGNDDDTLNDPRIPQTLEMESLQDETMESADVNEHLPLKEKRKLLRGQKIYDMDNSLDATMSENWSEEKTAMPEVQSKSIEASQEILRPLENKPPVVTVHVKRLHARRISSTSQAGQNSMDQCYPSPINQNLLSNKHSPLQTTHEIEDWDGEGEAKDIDAHNQPMNSGAPHHPVQTSPPTTTSIIPPFSVREPVEKQVRNWLESTSDEYDILLKRWSGRASIAKSKNGAENRSLELRHQASGESGKRVSACGSEAGHKKHLPRLWKQTTPMSQAIIQNHLEHQNQSFGRSPSKKELTVPSFGFDSGDVSMLQSLEENPEEDFMTLLPPVSSQRRFSDNPLTAKQRVGCAFQTMMSPAIINYSTCNLEPNVKLRSAPTRSFCCIYHKRQGYDKPYLSPNCTCSCSQLRKNPNSSSYTEMIMLYPGEMAIPNCCYSPQNSENLPAEECCNCSRHRINRYMVEDVTTEGVNNRCCSPLPHQSHITPVNLGSPPFLASPYRNPNSQKFTQERMSRQICHDRLTANRDSETPILGMMSKNETFDQELQRRLGREAQKEWSEEAVVGTQPQHSRLIPPDLVFSPASRRVSAVDIGEEVVGTSVINMLTINSPSRQLSRQNSIYSMEEYVHQSTISPQGSLCSERGSFLTPEYNFTAPISDPINTEPKQWVKPARSFDHFSRRNFSVHRAASHSPSHLATHSQEHSRMSSVHRSDTDCYMRTPQHSKKGGLGKTDGTWSRTPEFLSLDSSNSDTQHQEVEILKEHLHSYKPDGQQHFNEKQYYRSDSSGDGKRVPILLKFKPTSLTTSADCLKQRKMPPGTDVLSAGHQRVPNCVNSYKYREASKRLAQRKKMLGKGKDMHPRKSLEVESAFSSSQSSCKSQNIYARSKSSEIDMRSGVSPSKKCVRRDYTIDEKTDEIFQTFLQHDPLMDDMTTQHPPKGRKKSLQQT